MAEHAEDGRKGAAKSNAFTMELCGVFNRWSVVGRENVGSSRYFAMETIHSGWRLHAFYRIGCSAEPGRSPGIRLGFIAAPSRSG
ncbi:MAG: hypothetical protein OEW13_01060, partial [Nitrospira sp.]|nr:hypothetical protein [Nitrospira sp.]